MILKERRGYIEMLNNREILKLIREQKLIENCECIAEHITPNGFDLSVESIEEFNGDGTLLKNGKILPQTEEVMFGDGEDKYWLRQGVYKVKTREAINMPNNLVGFAFPRSSLLRMGIITQTGVWDAGFKGKSEFALVVTNPFGVSIEIGARIIQICFDWISEVDKGYDGSYQNLK